MRGDDRGGASLFRATALLLLLAGPLLFTGCNAGVVGVVVDLRLADADAAAREDSSRVQGPVSVVFEGIRNNRTNPAQTLVSFRLASEGTGSTEVVVEYSAALAPFERVVFQDPVPGRPPTADAEPGVLTSLATSPEGVLHEFGWNAAESLGGTGLVEVVLRFTAQDVLDVPVLVGNDAPGIESLRLIDQGDGLIAIEIVISDSSSDPVDLTLGVSTDLDAVAEGDFQPLNVLEVREGLPASTSGETTTLTWPARDDLGPLDRDVLVRVAPRDLVGEVTEGAGDPLLQAAFLDLNSDPVVSSVVVSRGAENGDRRRGLGVRFDVADAEGDDVDVVVQWASQDEDFVELPAEIDTDAAARERLLFSPESSSDRRLLGIVTLRSRKMSGPVVAPSAGVTLGDGELLATWLLARGELCGGFETLAGRAVSIDRGTDPPGGDGAQTRVVCGFAADTGILRLDAGFDPPGRPGHRLLIDAGGPSRLAATAVGVRHHVIWASDADVPGGGAVRVRVTPFDRAFAAADDLFASCRSDSPHPLAGAYPGDRGRSAETERARDLHGPFGSGGGAWKVPLAPVDDPAALATADIDGDGSMDVVAVSGEARSLVVSLQTAPGSFDQLRFLDERTGDPSDVLIADLDGDADLDIAVASGRFTTEPDPDRGVPAFDRPGSVMLYFQQGTVENGDLDFVADRVLLRAGGELRFPSAIAAADLDSDGDVDIAVVDAGAERSPVTVFYRGGGADGPDACGDTDSGYSACSIDIAGAGGSPGDSGDGYRDIEIVDFDGDADPDIIYTEEDSIVVLLNGGAGDFSEALSVAVPDADIRSIALVDIDGDGDDDLLAADPEAAEVIVLRRSGEREFDIGESLTTSSLRRPVSLLVTDVDGNGRDDVLIADEGDGKTSGRVVVCLADGNGDLTCASLDRSGDTAPRDLAVADFDRDGLIDIASIEAGAREVAIYLQEAPGSYSESGESLGPLPLSPLPTSVTVGDLDNNGSLDLVVSSVTADSLSVLLQGEDGVFDDRGDSAPSQGGFPEVALGDVNGDGLRDMVTSATRGDRISVWTQSADGTFAVGGESLTSDDLSGPQSIALGDVDGDGRLDIVSVGRFSGIVLWFAGGEGGVFGDAALVDVDAVGAATLSSPADVAVGDLDRDGRLDLAVAAHRGDEIWILMQGEGPGAFRPEIVELPDGTRPVALELVDLDGDGVTEILVAGHGAPSLFVLREIDGVYRPIDLSSNVEGHGLSSVSSADVDADGRIDLVVGSPSSGAIEVLRATGADGFAPARVLGRTDLRADVVSFVPVRTLALDVDGDGEIDILAVNRAQDDVIVFWGGR